MEKHVGKNLWEKLVGKTCEKTCGKNALFIRIDPHTTQNTD
jgi:hypothetical protein